MNTRIATLALGLAVAGPALAADPGIEQNGMLVDREGMTLYTYDKDTPGKSACVDQCTKNWPPLTAETGQEPLGKWTMFRREDGATQWAYDGKPVYTYAQDKSPGDMSGEGKGGVWHVLKP